jgi:outer membrane lipoprotein LolB
MGSGFTRLWPVLGLLFLSACAELPGLFHPKTVLPDSVKLGPPLERFTATGRLALSNGERRDHLRFQWNHSPEQDQVLLMSPLGQGIAELTRDIHGARLVKGNQLPLAATNLTELTQQVFGSALPLEHLTDWLRGAYPALTGEVDGWQVVVLELSPFRQHQLVRGLEVKQAEVEMKLIVDTWESPEDRKE